MSDTTKDKTNVAMPNCSWDFVVSTLNEVELRRFACCYLHVMGDKNVNMAAAASSFGSASANSFRIGLGNSLKKLNAAVDAAGETALETAAPKKPEPENKKKMGRPPKRKTDEDDQTENQIKKTTKAAKKGSPVVKPEDTSDKEDMITPPSTPKKAASSPKKKSNGGTAVGAAGKKVGKVEKKASTVDAVKKEDTPPKDFGDVEMGGEELV